jgi:hypothetical protein
VVAALQGAPGWFAPDPTDRAVAAVVDDERRATTAGDNRVKLPSLACSTPRRECPRARLASARVDAAAAAAIECHPAAERARPEAETALRSLGAGAYAARLLATAGAAAAT